MTELLAARRGSIDALGLLSVYVVLLVAIPSRLIIQPLGASGTPAQVFGVCLLVLWLLSRLLPRRPVDEIGPVKWLLLAFVLVSLISYSVGAGRPGMPEELRSADRALLTLAAWVGVTLVVSDGFADRERLERLLKLMSVAISGVAALGIVQFFFGIDISKLISIPGLSANHSFGSLTERSFFRRVSATTVHPIEFGVVLSTALPLLIHFAIHGRPGARRRWWLAAGVVAVALPMSIARTAILGALVVLLVAFWGWPRAIRRRALLFAPLGLLAMKVAIPGLLGTIRSLFLNASSDPSTTGRTADYTAVWYYFNQSPVTGRGLGTFVPSLYRTLDNQYLGTLVEQGLLGLLSLLALLLGTISVAFVLRNRFSEPADKSLALALGAALAVPLVTFVTFDGLSFPMAAGMTFLLTGAVAAMWRLERLSRAPARCGARVALRTWVPRAAVVAVASVLAVMPFGAWVLAGRVDYQAGATLLLDTPRPPGSNPFLQYPRADRAANILQHLLTGSRIRARLDERFRNGDYGVAVGDTSLERFSDALTTASILRVQTTAPTAAEAERMRGALLSAADSELLRMQRRVGVPEDLRLVARRLDVSAVTKVEGSTGRVAAALGAALVILVGAVSAALRFRPRRWDTEARATIAEIPAPREARLTC